MTTRNLISSQRRRHLRGMSKSLCDVDRVLRRVSRGASRVLDEDLTILRSVLKRLHWVPVADAILVELLLSDEPSIDLQSFVNALEFESAHEKLAAVGSNDLWSAVERATRAVMFDRDLNAAMDAYSRCIDLTLNFLYERERP